MKFLFLIFLAGPHISRHLLLSVAPRPLLAHKGLVDVPQVVHKATPPPKIPLAELTLVRMRVM